MKTSRSGVMIIITLTPFHDVAHLNLGAAPADGTEVDESGAELDECASFSRQTELTHVREGKVDEILNLLFAHFVQNRSRIEQSAVLKTRNEIVLQNTVYT